MERVRYEISASTGHYLRETMRRATELDIEHVLDAAAKYIGRSDEDREYMDDGSIVQGPLVARPVESEDQTEEERP